MNRHRKGFGDRKPRLAQERARKAVSHDPDQLHARDGACAASKKHGIKLTFYRCTFCPGYHLTKSVVEPEPVIIQSPVWHPTLLSLVGTIVKPMVRRIA